MARKTCERLRNTRRFVSECEVSVGAELHRLHIETKPQYQIAVRAAHGMRARGLSIDYWLPEFRAALEVNGTYWHCDPRTYPDGPVNRTQKNNLSRYREKQVHLANLGIPLIEVWEMDIKALGAEVATKQALHAFLAKELGHAA